MFVQTLQTSLPSVRAITIETGTVSSGRSPIPPGAVALHLRARLAGRLLPGERLATEAIAVAITDIEKHLYGFRCRLIFRPTLYRRGSTGNHEASTRIKFRNCEEHEGQLTDMFRSIRAPLLSSARLQRNPE